ncbi:DNA/RNA non-specific endonuclease [Paracoccus sp. (in: a-proteobacteria)]|uniref:DNA/RNA non-specific endonuclease n=1 Tax=Paracoccus sp. TaxID=267 RepID=UPI0035B2584B
MGEDDINTDILRRAEEALARWQARAKVRNGRSKALRAGKALQADTPSRLAARVNLLVDEVRRACDPGHMPSNEVLRELVERPAPVVAEELTDRIVNEALIGTADFLSVEFLERGALAARSVGRILIEAQGGRAALGTGFMVGPGLLITNQHVLTSARRAERCVLQMDYELRLFGAPRAPQDFVLEPARFFLSDEDLDFALVAVAGSSAAGIALEGYGWLPLIEAQGKIAISDKDHINIIQHPRGEEKQVVLRNNRVLDMRTGDEPANQVMGSFLHYEADTDKGSSGSPVLSDTWQVIGLHHSGVPALHDKGGWLHKNGDQWQDGRDRLEDVVWIANEAVRISSIVGAVKLAQLEPLKRAFVDHALAARPHVAWAMPGVTEAASMIGHPMLPPDPALPRPEASVALVAPSLVAGRVEIPLRVTVSLDGAGPGGLELALEAGRGAALEAISPADMTDRRGYDPDFLGVSLPLPGIKAKPAFGGAQPVTSPSHPGDEFELRYHNYSALVCAARRMAYLSACNVDFKAPAEASAGEGGGNWRYDPRIPRAAQMGARYYQHNPYDRGHLSRRDDLARGPTREAAIAANRDSFFWTNCAPQHELLNQSNAFTGADLKLWGDLENHIADQGPTLARISVFNGPVFGDADKPLYDVLVPLAFYKIVAWNGPDGTGALGFVLEQADLVEGLPEKRLSPGIFAIRMRPIQVIGAGLDVDLGDLEALDRFEAVQPSGKARKGLRAADGIKITSVADIGL